MSHCNDNNSKHKLVKPERNKYFYGKLLDDKSLTLEQCYFNQKRWLINRLGLGCGVVCGLQTTIKDNKVCIASGVALDSQGREIIVPDAVLIDPRTLTDDKGVPIGDTLNSGTHFYLCLAYKECATEFLPVLVTDCDSINQTAPSIIQESFRILIKSGEPNSLKSPDPALCEALHFKGDSQDAAINKIKKIEDINKALSNRDCSTGTDCACVVLAVVSIQDGTLSLKNDGAEPRVYSNPQLFEMLMCLSNEKGLKGDKGDPGIQGMKGDPGPTGPAGSIGLTGANGVDGKDGIGKEGPVGPAGPIGLTGANGVDGKDGIGKEGPVGPLGPIGLTGANGVDGKDGIGKQGPVGPIGAEGPAGPGLESKLTQIVALSWEHNTLYTNTNLRPPLVPVTLIDTNGGFIEDFGNAFVIGFSNYVTPPFSVPMNTKGLANFNPAFEVLIPLFSTTTSSVFVWSSIKYMAIPVSYFSTLTANQKIIDSATIKVNGTVGAPIFEPSGNGIAIFPLENKFDQLVMLRLRGDFFLDTAKPYRAIDAEFTRAELPTGDRPSGSQVGIQGGIFESWFTWQKEGGDGPDSTGPSRDVRLTLNRSSAFELAMVPEIGFENAFAIVAARDKQANKVFNDFENLNGVGSLTDEHLLRIREIINLN
ncbi:MAG: hypothetical protein V4732_08270 [Pseudomonadota bacterium]